MSQQKMVTSSAFSDNLKKAMDAKGLRSSDLGRAVGVDRAYISMFRNGKRENPSADVLEKLSYALGVNSEWLLTGEGSMRPPPSELAEPRTLPLEINEEEARKNYAGAALLFERPVNSSEILEGVETLIEAGKSKNQEPEKTLRHVCMLLKGAGYL